MASRSASPSLSAVRVYFAASVAERETVSGILHRLAGYCTDLLPLDGAGVLLRGSDDVVRFATARSTAVHTPPRRSSPSSYRRRSTAEC